MSTLMNNIATFTKISECFKIFGGKCRVGGLRVTEIFFSRPYPSSWDLINREKMECALLGSSND